MDGMAMFEKAKQAIKEPELAQKIGEASFSDDSLGLSSDGK